MIDDGSAVPPIVIDDAFAAFTGLVTDDTTGFAGATVSFTAVNAVDATDGLPAASVETAVTDNVPSDNDVTSTLGTDQAPPEPATTDVGNTSAVPSETSTATVEPGSAVPPTVIDDAFAAFTGLVTDDTTGFAGATVSFT